MTLTATAEGNKSKKKNPGYPNLWTLLFKKHTLKVLTYAKQEEEFRLKTAAI